MTLAKTSTLLHLSHCSPCLGCHTRCFLGLHSVFLSLNPLNLLFNWVAWREGQEVIEHGHSSGCKTPAMRNISCASGVAISSLLNQSQCVGSCTLLRVLIVSRFLNLLGSPPTTPLSSRVYLYSQTFFPLFFLIFFNS